MKGQESDERAEILVQTNRKPGNQDQPGDDEYPMEVQEDLAGHLVRDDKDDVIVLPDIIGFYKTSLSSQKTMRKAHVMTDEVRMMRCSAHCVAMWSDANKQKSLFGFTF